MWALFLFLFSMSCASEDIKSYLLSHPEVVAEALSLHQENQRQSALTELVGNTDTQVVVGNPGGEHVLVAFVDYRCGACRRTHGWVQSFVSKNKNVKFVVKPLPVLGAESTAASLMLYDAAEVGAAEDVHNQLMSVKVDQNGMHALGKEHHVSVYSANAFKDHWAFKNLEKNYQDSVSLDNQSVPLFILSVNGQHKVFRGLASEDELALAYQQM